MEGPVGLELDRVVDQRIASDFAVKEIVPEATRAFEIRKDDQFHEGRGLWQGEFWGKWMLSAVAAYQYTGDESIKTTIQRETEKLIATQDDNGYIGSYKNSAFVEGDVWNVWNRKYALWGLVEAYEVLQDPDVLRAAQGLMDHLMTEVGPDQVPMVKTGNFYGLPSSSILTPLVRLYLHTEEPRYLNYAEYIVDNWHSVPDSPPSIVQKGLTGAPVHQWFPEKGKWTKAYEFISCVEGLVDLYQVVGNPNYRKAATNIYDAIRENERVITGGIGYHDKLVGASLKPSGLNEPCDVVYWERLSAKLLALTGDPSYADEIERLTYNVLLGSFNRQGDWGVRRLGLNEAHLVSPLHAFTYHHQCCVANVPRGMLQLGQVTVMSARDHNELLVNLFIPGQYHIGLSDGSSATLRMTTEYPTTGEVLLAMEGDNSFQGKVTLRKPDWCENITVAVNGESIESNPNEHQVTIERSWKKGDTISVAMDMPPRVIEIPNEPDYKAIMRGPVVLARSSLLEEEDHLEQPYTIDSSLTITPVPEAKRTGETWMEFEAVTTDGDSFLLSDYASTGREYEKPTDPTAWEEMLKNEVDTDLRVWLKTKDDGK